MTDSQACAIFAICEWHVLFSSRILYTKKQTLPEYDKVCFMVGDDGFEPSKRNATDLQSAPFGHSGNLPQHFDIITDTYIKCKRKI